MASADGSSTGWPAIGPRRVARPPSTGADRWSADGSIVCFTTGVWGEPRPVAFRPAQQDAWLSEARGSPAGGGERVLVADDVTTLHAWRAVLEALAGGGTAHVLERWHPKRLARRLRGGGYDRLVATGPQLNQLAADLTASGVRERWPLVPRIEAGGGMLHRRAALVLGHRCEALVSTGLTIAEAGGRATSGELLAPARHHPLDVGRARPGLRVVVRRDGGDEARPGEVGELHLDGEAVGTLRTATRTGEVPTGDLARVDRHGMVHLLGRRSDRFACNGVEVVPALVELALAGHPGVADVAVVPRPDVEHGAVPVAVIVPADPEAPPFLDDLAPRLAELPAAWRPRAEAVVERLPLTASGQLHRRMLAFDEVAR